MRERRKFGDAGIAHFGVLKMKPFKVWHFSNGSQTFIGDLAASQIKPDDAFCDRLKKRKLVVAKFFGGIDDIDPESIIFSGDRHDGEMEFLGREGHFIHAFLLFFL